MSLFLLFVFLVTFFHALVHIDNSREYEINAEDDTNDIEAYEIKLGRKV